MDFTRLKQTLKKPYGELDPARRWDQAERIAATALAWADASEEDVDRDLVEALAYLLTVRREVVPKLALRNAVETCFVEQGWTPLRIRALIRALERMPEKPETLEEKLVADADTLTCLGLLGLVRQVAMAAATGESLEALLARARRSLSRRTFTAVGHAQAVALRDELRDLLRTLEKALARA
jgi:hypothetical protein